MILKVIDYANFVFCLEWLLKIMITLLSEDYEYDTDCGNEFMKLLINVLKVSL